MTKKTTFYTGRNGRIIADINGKVILPDKYSHFSPQEGEEWEVELEDKGRFFIARPIRRVERLYYKAMDGDRVILEVYSGSRHVGDREVPLSAFDRKIVGVRFAPGRGFVATVHLSYRGKYTTQVFEDIDLGDIPEKFRDAALQHRGELLEREREMEEKTKAVKSLLRERDLPPIKFKIFKIPYTVVYPGDGMRDDDNVRVGHVVKYLVPPEFKNVVPGSQAIAKIAGMDWGQYVTDILEAAEDGDEAAIEFDEKVRAALPKVFRRVQLDIEYVESPEDLPGGLEGWYVTSLNERGAYWYKA